MSENKEKTSQKNTQENTSPIVPIMKEPQYLTHSAESIQFKQPQYVMEYFIPGQTHSSDNDDE